MAKWIPTFPESEFTNRVKVFEYDGERIAIFKLDDGYYAIDDECSHAHAYLSEGELFNHMVACPRHGARFDVRTGKNLTLPAVRPVKSYPTRVEEGMVYIEVDE